MRPVREEERSIGEFIDDYIRRKRPPSNPPTRNFLRKHEGSTKRFPLLAPYSLAHGSPVTNSDRSYSIADYKRAIFLQTTFNGWLTSRDRPLASRLFGLEGDGSSNEQTESARKKKATQARQRRRKRKQKPISVQPVVKEGVSLLRKLSNLQGHKQSYKDAKGQPSAAGNPEIKSQTIQQFYKTSYKEHSPNRMFFRINNSQISIASPDIHKPAETVREKQFYRTFNH